MYSGNFEAFDGSSVEQKWPRIDKFSKKTVRYSSRGRDVLITPKESRGVKAGAFHCHPAEGGQRAGDSSSWTESDEFLLSWSAETSEYVLNFGGQCTYLRDFLVVFLRFVVEKVCLHVGLEQFPRSIMLRTFEPFLAKAYLFNLSNEGP